MSTQKKDTCKLFADVFYIRFKELANLNYVLNAIPECTTSLINYYTRANSEAGALAVAKLLPTSGASCSKSLSNAAN
jgi:hypothetical protein